MYHIDRYIGQQVRRTMFMLSIDNKYYNLLSIFERMEVDMPDISTYSSNFIKRSDGAKNKKHKVYLTVEYITLTQDLLDAPWDNNYSADDTERILSFDADYRYCIASLSNDVPIIQLGERKHSMCNLLPYRSRAAYISYYQPLGNGLREWIKKESIKEQLRDLSTRWLNYDVLEYAKYLGDYIFVSYNPIYRNLSWREEKDKLGVLCKINHLRKESPLLKFEISGYNKANALLFNKSYYTNRLLNRFSFKSLTNGRFKYLEVKIFDQDGNVVDYYPHLCFVNTIQTIMQVADKTIRIANGAESVKDVEKYLTLPPMIVGEKPVSLLETDEYSYRRLEESLDFAFLEGSKDEDERITLREKGIEYVLKMLDSAIRECYICDIYFGTQDFQDFIIRMKSINVPIHILTSVEAFKLNLTKDDSTETTAEKIESAKEDFRKELDKYNKFGAQVTCRLFKGSPILHDRMIMVDNNIWLLGSSLNHFGMKATTLCRVPKEYRAKIMNQVCSWWNSDEETIEL